MSSGPIKAWRDSWLPPQASTKNSQRVCFKKLIEAKAYCGRKPRESYDYWEKVNCADCLAAHLADTEGSGQ